MSPSSSSSLTDYVAVPIDCPEGHMFYKSYGSIRLSRYVICPKCKVKVSCLPDYMDQSVLDEFELLHQDLLRRRYLP